MSSGRTFSPALDPKELRRLLSHAEGELAETPFAELVLAAAVLERSLVVELRRNALYKRIIIEEGVPVDSRSNIATESLGRFLVAQGRLSESAFQASLSDSVAHDLPLEEVLVQRELIPAADVLRLLQQNLGRKLLDAFSWQSGTYRISGSLPPVQSPLRVRVPQLLLTGMLRFEPQERVDRTFTAMGDRALVLSGDGPFSLDDLRLASEQMAVVNAMGNAGEWIRNLRGADGSTEEIHRLLHALFKLGLVEVINAPGEKTRPAVSPAPAQAPEPVPADGASQPVLDRDELLTAYLSFRRKDALELFDLPETAGIVQINRAWMDFARRFVPWQFPPEPDGLREKAQEIFFAGSRAYGDLADPDRRAAVVARRHAAEAKPATPFRSEPERETLVDPEELYRRGRELATSGKVREALSYFEMAADCDAQNGTYAAELAWSRFELMITTAALTMKALKNALRIDPRSGAANLYVGRIHSTLGNHLEAEGYILKASQLMPRDPRVAEALRIVRKR